MIAWLSGDAPFPPLELALDDPNGLLAAGADLTPQRLVAAYRRGIFPWYSEGQPILWWSPNPRMVLYVDDFKISRSLRKRIRQQTFDVRIDTAFHRVVEACAHVPRTGQYGTWITPAMMLAYTDLHDRGYAHSVEAWHDGELVGGLYGLALGRVFFGESMFANQTDASKVALAGLVAVLQELNVPLIDCQQETSHLASLGARPISRRRFAGHLAELIDSNAPPAAWPKGALSWLS
jgi:leucyl/phenylalanyl-tRNA--protein transferase